jgi:uncharacterized membrane protein YjgN (DUF898 family)
MTAAATDPDAPLALGYAGEGRPLFWLTLKTLALTVLTLGIYRFWMKARLRRYYWSAVRVGGQPLEFTGTGVEMLIGFFIAVVFLALYLGLFNLLLAFAGMVIFEHPLALNLSALAVVPLVYYARYRARRYLLSRTRLRGIRFGMDRGAVDYMLRALGLALLAVATLGFMVPYMDFRLRKFAVDRSWFGTLRFRQEGAWTGFLRPWLGVMGAILLVVLGAAAAFATRGNPAAIAIVVIGYVALLPAMVNYQVASFRYAADHSVLGDALRFRSDVRTGRVIGIWVVGSILVGVIAIAASVVTGVLGLVVARAIGVVFDPSAFFAPGGPPPTAGTAGLVILGVTYLVAIVVTSAFAQVLITQPVLRTYIVTMAVSGQGALDLALQRPQERMSEAEGFADALDVGAAF